VRVVTMDRWWSDALKGSGRLTAAPAQTRDTTNAVSASQHHSKWWGGRWPVV
jgi:hypothetical protein